MSGPDTAPGRELTRPKGLSARLSAYPPGAASFTLLCHSSARIGRSPEASVPINDTRASREHAELVRKRDGGLWELRDLDSRNGTWLCGNRISVTSLRHGDVFRIGDTVMVFELSSLDTAFGTEPSSPVALKLAFELADASGDDLPVLLLGPTGTGKTWMAEKIATKSARKGPFVHVNCAELPPSLLESELFGAVRGAFTGANADRRGLIESANGGTIFLDEIATLSADLQAKLLTVLERGFVRRVGAQTPTPVDVRYIAATNVDVREAIATGAFREDLYFRLAVHEVHIPPLRNRRADILPIFLEALGSTTHTELTPETCEALLCYDWPGNIRELLNVARVCTQSPRPVDYHALPMRIQRTLAGRVSDAAPETRARGVRPARIQMKKALNEANGNVSQLARSLGEHRTQVVRWLRHYGLDRDSE